MGIRVRIFFCAEDSVRSFPYAKFERLWNGDTADRIPEYAGQRIKYALVTVYTEKRQPIEITHIDCSYIVVDDKGKFDQDSIQKSLVDAINCIDLLSPSLTKQGNIIDATLIFNKKRYENKYTWELTPNQFLRINELIFG